VCLDAEIETAKAVATQRVGSALIHSKLDKKDEEEEEDNDKGDHERTMLTMIMKHKNKGETAAQQQTHRHTDTSTYLQYDCGGLVALDDFLNHRLEQE
jgi:hypothetical protein